IDDFRGTDAAIDTLLAKCASDTACAVKYPDLRTRFLSALPRLRQRPLKIGDKQVNDTEVVTYIRGYLFAGNPVLLEARVQSLLAYMDAVARGDAEAMGKIAHRMPEEKPDDTPVPPEGWYSMGQNLSVECNEERSFESVDGYRQAAARS